MIAVLRWGVAGADSVAGAGGSTGWVSSADSGDFRHGIVNSALFARSRLTDWIAPNCASGTRASSDLYTGIPSPDHRQLDSTGGIG